MPNRRIKVAKKCGIGKNHFNVINTLQTPAEATINAISWFANNNT